MPIELCASDVSFARESTHPKSRLVYMSRYFRGGVIKYNINRYK